MKRLASYAVAVVAIPGWMGSAQAQVDTLNVVATFSVLGDLVERVAGDDANISVLTPIGAEAHEWELTPGNFMTLQDADLVFYNGYQFEQWMNQVVSTVEDGVPLIAVAEASDYPTLSIVTGEYEGTPDPHLWMDPRASASFVQVIADALSDALPEAAERFSDRADALAEQLDALYSELQETLSVIPDDQRLLITSEAAFIYFADAFDFQHDGIWGNNAETEGAPRRLMRVVDLVRDKQPGAIFWESTISDRYVTSVADDTGVAIAGPLYVDSLSAEGGDAADYFSMMRHNAELLSDALGDTSHE